jgi:DNA-binding NtrC family response regulator
MVGSSPAMLDVFARIRRYAPSDAPVLITGESGSGKELAARAIHERSGRAGGPFIAVNCAALPAALIASELFGHEKGAFTGAVARRIGFVEQAHKGTLFLDEIGDLPMELQGYLLRFLQDSMITRIGGTETVRVDVRILSATNVPLDGAIRKREFREDLFYRLAVLTLRMPALRERGDDVELLATYLLREVARDLRREVEGFTPAALSAIRAHPWPGNVRELISVVRRAVVMADGALIDADRLGLDERRGAAEPAVAAPSRPRAGSPEEGAVLRAALARCSGNVSIAARSLGVSRMTLYRMLKRHGLAPDTSPT